MTKTWLDRLCDPLLHPKYKQIKGRLVEIDEHGQIIGKCAEGEIACQNNIKYSDNQCYLLNAQLVRLGIPKDLIYNIPSLWTSQINFDDIYESDGIGDYIYKLNDHGFTYKQIVKFLRTTFEDAV